MHKFLMSWTRFEKTMLLAVCLYAIPLFFITPQISGNWDEKGNRDIASRAIRIARFTLTDRLDMFTRKEKTDDHGPFISASLRLLEPVFGLHFEAGDEGRIHLLYHFVMCGLFLVGLFYFGLLLRKVGVSTYGVVLGLICLALHPRIFNNAFHNYSDIGFLVLCILVSYYAFRFIDRPTFAGAAVAGLVTGMAVDTRIIAAMFLVMIVGLVVIRSLYERSYRQLRPLMLYMLCSFATIYALWPILWLAPLENFIWAFKSNTDIRWAGVTLFLGEYIRGYDVPWYYNPLWIAITTPLPALILVCAGVVQGTRSFFIPIREYFFTHYKTLWLYAWAMLPLLAPMLLQTTLFDAWRHHFFVYPALVALGMLAFDRVVAWFKGFPRWVVPTVIAVIFASHLVPVLRLHPWQIIYFNELYDLINFPKNGVGHAFDMDYWGLSYRRGLEVVAKDSGDRNVVVKVALLRPAVVNHYFLSDKDRKRITVIDPEDARAADFDYFIGDYHFQDDEYDPETGTEFYALTYKHAKFLTVRRHHASKQE